jgi:hypothetical protein
MPVAAAGSVKEGWQVVDSPPYPSYRTLPSFRRRTTPWSIGFLLAPVLPGWGSMGLAGGI